MELHETKHEYASTDLHPEIILAIDEILYLKEKDHFFQLQKRACDVIKRRLQRLERSSNLITKNVKLVIGEKQSRYLDFLRKISDAKHYDDLLYLLLILDSDKKDRIAVGSLIRQILFYKVFFIQSSKDYLDIVCTSLGRGISPTSLHLIFNIVDHYVLRQVLYFKDNHDGYWDTDLFQFLRREKRRRQLKRTFSKLLEKLTIEIHRIQLSKSDEKKIVCCKPDRGLVGEMAGYIGDSCYTRKYPLLRDRKNLIPFKIVLGVENGLQVPIGSALVFEVEDHEGISLLVRAFNIPGESDYDIQGILEAFFDNLMDQSHKNILVPGLADAISNYPLTVHYVTNTYLRHNQPVTLKKKFSFNGYDITENCYVVRKMNKY